MWQRRHYNNKPNFYHKKTTSLVDKDFQVKYTLIFVFAAAFCMLLIIIPTYYYLDQNYSIFEELAYETSPEILTQLKREQANLTLLIISTFSGFIVFFSILGLRITSQIIAPLKILKNHLKKLSRGHWSQEPITIRKKDEFKDVIASYNYFYKSFQAQIRKDLKILEEFHIKKDDYKTYQKYSLMIQEKLDQLDLEKRESDSSSAEPPTSLKQTLDTPPTKVA